MICGCSFSHAPEHQPHNCSPSDTKTMLLPFCAQEDGKLDRLSIITRFLNKAEKPFSRLFSNKVISPLCRIITGRLEWMAASSRSIRSNSSDISASTDSVSRVSSSMDRLLAGNSVGSSACSCFSKAVFVREAK